MVDFATSLFSDYPLVKIVANAHGWQCSEYFTFRLGQVMGHKCNKVHNVITRKVGLHVLTYIHTLSISHD